MLNVPITLPRTIEDKDGFDWDVTTSASILDGETDAFDGGFVWTTFVAAATALLSEHGNEINIGGTVSGASGVTASRSIYVSDTRGYARFLDTFTNTTGAPVAFTYTLTSNLGSDANTTIVTTGSGDTTFNTADNYLTTSDNGIGDSIVTHFVQDALGPVNPATASVVGENVTITYSITLAAFETRSLLSFGFQNASTADAAAQVTDFQFSKYSYLEGLTLAERNQVQNFDVNGTHTFATEGAINLFDADGFLWDLGANGSVLGVSPYDAFDGGFVVTGAPNTASAAFAENGREVNYDPFNPVAGISGTRSVYVSDRLGFARFLDSFNNTTGAPITFTYTMTSDLGSDSATAVAATGSGDTTFTNGDTFVTTSDGTGFDPDPANGTGRDPFVTHYLNDGTGLAPLTASLVNGVLTVNYSLTVNPGETKSLLSFGFQNQDAAAATAQVNDFKAAKYDYLAGLTFDERNTVVNFDVDAEHDFILEGDFRLRDADGFRWNLTFDLNGSGDAFGPPSFDIPTYNRNASFDSIFTDGGREINQTGALTDQAGLAPARSVYVSDTLGYARFLDSFTNTTSAAITYTFAFNSRFAPLSADVRLIATGSGDTAYQLADTFISADDSSDGNGGAFPVATLVFQDGTRDIPSGGNAAAGSVFANVQYTFTIKPGETLSFMSFAFQNANAADATNEVNNFFGAGAGSQIDYYEGLSPQERARLMNFSGLGDAPTNFPNNFIIGTPGNDDIDALGGADRVYVGPGDDILRGESIGDGLSHDFYDGGDGSDVLVYSGAFGSEYTVDLAAGQRQAQVGGGPVFVSDTFINVENVTIAGSERVIGDGNANVITGTAASNNTFSGGGGNDTIVGGGGADTLDGGEGDDTLTYFSGDIAAGETIDGGTGTDVILLAEGGVYNFIGITITRVETLDYAPSNVDSTAIFLGALNGGLGNIVTVDGSTGTDTLVLNALADVDLSGVNFSNWTSGTDAITIAGTAAGQHLTGSDQNDFIAGVGGVDIMNGGAGDDTFAYANGTDALAGETIDGGTGTDRILLPSGSYNFTGVNIANVETLTFSNNTGLATATFLGSQIGPGKIATVIGISSTSQGLIVNAASDVDLSGVTFTNWTNGTDTVTINGSAAADTLIGSDQNDTINGLGEADALDGGGGGGDDTLTGGAGNDALVGGNGIDTAVFAGPRTDYVVVANAGGHRVSKVGETDLLNGIEFLQFDDVTIGTAAPTDIALTNASVAENSAAGTVVGVLSALDPDAGETFSFSLADSAGGRFAVVGTNLVVNGALDFETAASHNVTVRVRDAINNGYDETFTINLTDVNDAPKVTLANAVFGMGEGTIAGPEKVADIVVNDDALGANTLGLAGPDAAFFQIVGTELFLKTGTVLDFERKSVYAVAVTVDDPGVGTAPDHTTPLHVLSVLDVDEAPVDITLTQYTVFENSVPSTLVGIFSTIDQEPGASQAEFTYTLVGDSGPFAVEGNLLLVEGAIDYESAATHGLTVRVTDAGNNSFEKTFLLHVIDIVGGGPSGTSTAGGDVLVGTANPDHLDGQGGNDFLVGGGGGDLLTGGEGSDTIDYASSPSALLATLIGGGVAGGDADGDAFSGIENVTGSGFGDAIFGDDGPNTLLGLDGDDIIIGLGGDDIIDGGRGAETIIGNAGNDWIRGGQNVSGFDQLFGYEGDDRLEGGTGVDFLAGGSGNDTLIGGEGGDALHGQEDDDTVYGENGDDVVIGQEGNDTLYGGGGNDTAIGHAGNDTISGGRDNDQLFGYEDIDSIDGGQGDDFLAGGDGNDALTGGEGGDVLDGENDDDALFGGNDGDNLNGNFGDDVLFGDAGNDGLLGFDGNDILNGGEGNDFLIGDRADGTGARGTDTFVFQTLTGNDNIADFQGGAGAGDVIDLRAFASAGLTSFAAVMNNAADVNGGVYILLQAYTIEGQPATDAIFLENFAKANLAPDDFLLA